MCAFPGRDAEERARSRGARACGRVRRQRARALQQPRQQDGPLPEERHFCCPSSRGVAARSTARQRLWSMITTKRLWHIRNPRTSSERKKQKLEGDLGGGGGASGGGRGKERVAREPVGQLPREQRGAGAGRGTGGDQHPQQPGSRVLRELWCLRQQLRRRCQRPGPRAQTLQGYVFMFAIYSTA